MRLPPGWDAVEAPARASAAKSLARGAVTANLEVKREGAVAAVRVNEEVLAAVLRPCGRLPVASMRRRRRSTASSA
jgi:uncharacterized protein YicC (UPF0701 family)